MNARLQILSAISRNKPELKALPRTLEFQTQNFNINILAEFQNVIRELHGQVVEAESYMVIKNHINNWQEINNGRIFNTVPQLSNTNSSFIEKPHLLENIELSVVEGKLGVAENGAIWLEEDSISHRVVPFICQHLAIVLRKESIVSNMHDAYLKIGTIKTGYGVFISGPSKTADIEQSLVIGAHGPRSLTVYLL